jgi:phosphohistidine phosphatase
VCSSAKRARQTWKLVAKQLDNVPPSRVDDRLYAASVRCLLAVVRKLPDSARAVLLIGHNPGLEELVGGGGGQGRELGLAPTDQNDRSVMALAVSSRR